MLSQHSSKPDINLISVAVMRFRHKGWPFDWYDFVAAFFKPMEEAVSLIVIVPDASGTEPATTSRALSRGVVDINELLRAPRRIWKTRTLHNGFRKVGSLAKIENASPCQARSPLLQNRLNSYGV